MDNVRMAVRRQPKLAGRMLSSERLRVAVLPPASRLSLRAPQASLAPLAQALGLMLPVTPKTSSAQGNRLALWLGPDEWLVIDADGSDLASKLAGLDVPHSAVDVSHRNVGIQIEGPAAEAIISAGCPQDLSLSVFPVGACSRTVLGKVEIVLVRTADQAFHLECWRSFSDHVFAFLSQAADHEG